MSEFINDKSDQLYCGNSESLPHGYNGFASRHQCLKKGIGVGLNMLESKRKQTRLNMEKKNDHKDKIYCGLGDTLPSNYDRFGNKTECLQKGVGIGVHKLDYVKPNKTKVFSLNELEELANRLNLEYENKTKLELMTSIIYKMIAMRRFMKENR